MTTGAVVIPIKQGDLIPSLRVGLTDPPSAPGAPRSPADLTGATSASLRLRKVGSDELTIEDGEATVDIPGAIIEYDWQEGDTEDPGIYEAEITVTFADGSDLTWPSDGYFLVRIVARL